MPSSAVFSPEEHYAAIAAALVKAKGVTISSRRGFGQGGLMIHGKLFAVLRGATLLLKLPADRVAELIASKEGGAFDAGKGKPMREWVTIGPHAHAKWLQLAREALQFGQR
jgi:hypothetical protein